ncbi:MAG: helix-turn-helix transcriptional regulator [Selenomonadaceae bacterium]|nr:helix-turn-helix transcriptional regulator [Selenomonadaceae bacterium]
MNQIRKFRKKRNLKQSELALLVGVNRTAVTKWESGAANPRTDKLLKIADALRCSIDDLLSGRKKGK